jgi:hypothetical protein
MELVPAQELRRQFEVNVLGPMTITQAVLPLLRTAHGRIVNVGAPTGWVGAPLLGPIGASKAALHLINDALRLELRHQGISVSLIVPGAMETEIFATAEAAGKSAGPSSPEAERVYTKVVQTAAERMADMKLAPVDATVNAIHRALTVRHPKAAYTVGRDARQLALVRHLPRGVRDRALMGAVGVSRETFEEDPAKVNRVAMARSCARPPGGRRFRRRKGARRVAPCGVLLLVRSGRQAVDAGAAQDRAEQLRLGLASSDRDYDPVVHLGYPNVNAYASAPGSRNVISSVRSRTPSCSRTS